MRLVYITRSRSIPPPLHILASSTLPGLEADVLDEGLDCGCAALGATDVHDTVMDE